MDRNTDNSPSVAADQAIRARRAVPAHLGRFYLIELAAREGSYMAETPILPRGKNLSSADALAELRQHDNAIAVYECIPNEGYVRDVSEDCARLWLTDLLREGWNPEEDVWPDFISSHITNDEAMREFSSTVPEMVA